MNELGHRFLKGRCCYCHVQKTSSNGSEQCQAVVDLYRETYQLTKKALLLFKQSAAEKRQFLAVTQEKGDQ